jgi:Ubiquitin family
MATELTEWTTIPRHPDQLSDSVLLETLNDTHLDECTKARQQPVENQSALLSGAISQLASAQTRASAQHDAYEIVSQGLAERHPNRPRVRFVEEPTWQIFVRMPRGYRIALKVRPSDTARDVRSMISERVGLDNLEEQCIPEEFQRLLYNFRRLHDGQTLVQNLISDNSTLDLYGRTLEQV